MEDVTALTYNTVNYCNDILDIPPVIIEYEGQSFIDM